MRYYEILIESSTLSPILDKVPYGRALLRFMYKDTNMNLSSDVSVQLNPDIVLSPNYRSTIYDFKGYIVIGSKGCALLHVAVDAYMYVSNVDGINDYSKWWRNIQPLNHAKRKREFNKIINEQIGEIKEIYNLNYTNTNVRATKRNSRHPIHNDIKKLLWSLFIDSYKPKIILELKNTIEYMKNLPDKQKHNLRPNYNILANLYSSLKDNSLLDYQKAEIVNKLSKALMTVIENENPNAMDYSYYGYYSTSHFLTARNKPYILEYIKKIQNGDYKLKQKVFNYFLDELVR